ncbi:MAG TPA: class I lanthipeptide [Bacteroidia bacterium]|jgi:hypothetical protein|nr:class I lanthipeptide [Bacteroidia bacterium]
MKKVKIESKLMLKKERIAQLGKSQLDAIKGGTPPIKGGPIGQATITCTCLTSWVCQ